MGWGRWWGWMRCLRLRTATRVLRVRLPAGMARYVVEKGSIAVEGISLTVAGIEGDEIWIAILPHTYRATNLHTLKVGMGVNLEVDVLAKYAESRARAEKKSSRWSICWRTDTKAVLPDGPTAGVRTPFLGFAWCSRWSQIDFGLISRVSKIILRR